MAPLGLMHGLSVQQLSLSTYNCMLTKCVDTHLDGRTSLPMSAKNWSPAHTRPWKTSTTTPKGDFNSEEVTCQKALSGSKWHTRPLSYSSIALFSMRLPVASHGRLHSARQLQLLLRYLALFAHIENIAASTLSRLKSSTTS